MATRLMGNYLKAIAPSTKIQSYSWRRITFLFAPWRMNRGQPWTLDSTLWIPDSRYWTPVFVSGACIVDSIVSGIPDSLSCMPGSMARDSGFQKENFPTVRIPQAYNSRVPESRFPYMGQVL